jgi:hypothetical protein
VRVSRRSFLQAAAAAPLALRLPRAGAAPAEVLYNGIRLAEHWPPPQPLSFAPQVPPYLAAPPPVIRVDVGRQLFVDDFLIAETTMTRAFHRATYHPASPVLQPDKAWERSDRYHTVEAEANPAAMVFSDGVFYDPADRLFKMWYMAGYAKTTALATSHDGVRWTKPAFDVVPGTNLVSSEVRDSSTVWLDLEEADRSRRFKRAHFEGGAPQLPLFLSCSADGVHWRRVGQTGPVGDRTTFFYNPFRQVWVFSIRDEVTGGFGRLRRYAEAHRFDRVAPWQRADPVLWAMADRNDVRRSEYAVQPQLYNLDCVAYESVVLGLFTMWRGEAANREKPNDVCVGFSRDGFHFWRGTHDAFIGVSEQFGAWNWGNVQSAGGCCLIVGDRLHFYVSGRAGRAGTQEPGRCSTGLATLRRDGFASMQFTPAAAAPGRDAAPACSLITRPMTFDGRYLFVNYSGGSGALRVEVLDDKGAVIAPFTLADCVPIRGDHVKRRVVWQRSGSLRALAGRPVRLRFTATGGDLYAFWVSRWPTGESAGYVGAGGPAYASSRDVPAGVRRGPAAG